MSCFVPRLRTAHYLLLLLGIKVLRRIEHLETDNRDCPKQEVLISDCGVLGERQDDGLTTPDGRPADIYPDFPQDYEGPKTIENLVNIAKILKDSGNEVFREADFLPALEFYDKVVFKIIMS
jgi:peptidyl-prolyl isomerase D